MPATRRMPATVVAGVRRSARDGGSDAALVALAVALAGDLDTEVNPRVAARLLETLRELGWTPATRQFVRENPIDELLRELGVAEVRNPDRP